MERAPETFEPSAPVAEAMFEPSAPVAEAMLEAMLEPNAPVAELKTLLATPPASVAEPMSALTTVVDGLAGNFLISS